MSRSAYLCGPITGEPDGNRAAFDHAARVLRAEGIEIYNPRDHPDSEACYAESALLGDRYHEGPIYRALMRDHYRAVLDSGRLFVLPRWDSATGAVSEVLLAQRVGIPVVAYDLLPERRIWLAPNMAIEVGWVPQIEGAA